MSTLSEIEKLESLLKMATGAANKLQETLQLQEQIILQKSIWSVKEATGYLSELKTLITDKT